MYNCEIAIVPYKHAGAIFERFGQLSAVGLSGKTTAVPQQLTAQRLALADTCGNCKRQTIPLQDQVSSAYGSPVSGSYGCISGEVLCGSRPYSVLPVQTESTDFGRFNNVNTVFIDTH